MGTAFPQAHPPPPPDHLCLLEAVEALILAALYYAMGISTYVNYCIRKKSIVRSPRGKDVVTLSDSTYSIRYSTGLCYLLAAWIINAKRGQLWVFEDNTWIFCWEVDPNDLRSRSFWDSFW